MGRIDELGIIDGKEVVMEFVDACEFGLAYEHLVYMINGSGVDLSDEQLLEISGFAAKVAMGSVQLSVPTILEINAFFEVLELFQERQQIVVQYIIDNYGKEVPMTAAAWGAWSRNTIDESNRNSATADWITPHGFGLLFKNEEFTIDFDFGENGETNGFDAYRIWFFIEENQLSTLLRSWHQVGRIVNHLVTHGALEFSGYLNYYRK